MSISIANRIQKLETGILARTSLPKVFRVVVNAGEEQDVQRLAADMGCDVRIESNDVLVVRVITPPGHH